ncbi:MAG: UDP-N-acetylmuramate dehydrogenase [Elusimicrobiota bacterium]|jgi:UDP-N-acetylmuramate dehydrogenase|nr:UDP-N-acetylmuramate dehydrogenase [Elusimicrobiota bacterium]
MIWEEKLKTAGITPVVFNAPMAACTTYKTGGAAQALALPQNLEQLKNILLFAKENNLRLRVLGLGSNILVSDGGVSGVVCCLKNISGVDINGNMLSAGAGAPLDEVVRKATDAGLEGLEGLSGIPGSVGGAVFMNAGAYNQETFDHLLSIDFMDESGRITTLLKKDLKYGYRRVEGIENLIVLNALWRLTPAQNAAALKTRRLEILASRAQKQPLEYPSAGSVFKRPPNNFASALIDKCGLKGLRIGAAQVSPKHAGFIVNTGNAAAADIKQLMDEVQKRVLAQTGVRLELEQILWGDF